VVRNKGAPGVDGHSVEQVATAASRVLPTLRRALLNGSYQPGDIRRVWIPKPGGGQRGLGIPNVVDRWVQQALLQVLEPLFDPTFHESSHGFRPGRGAHTAVAEAKGYVAENGHYVVDIDLAEFFDRVSHQRLLSRLAGKVDDRRVLRLVRQMLKAKVVLPDGTKVATDEGTPQGGPLSPLLSNIGLDELDWELDRRGLRFVRYADDAKVYVGSERAGRRVMASLRRFIEGRMRLRVNEEKSAVIRPEKSHLLGFYLVSGDRGLVDVHLSARTIKRLRRRIRDLTPCNWGQSVSACMDRVNRYLAGWSSYFRLCTEQGAKLFCLFDAHIRRRIRCIILRQQKRPRFLFCHLRRRRVSWRAAARTAFRSVGPWKKSNLPGMTRAYPNAWFSSRLVSAWACWQALNPPPPASWQYSFLPN
jgi:RNA-directed DNA polymerase